jgi:hypothetical protein
VTLVLRKSGNTWKIVHGHESTFSCLGWKKRSLRFDSNLAF